MFATTDNRQATTLANTARGVSTCCLLCGHRQYRGLYLPLLCLFIFCTRRTVSAGALACQISPPLCILRGVWLAAADILHLLLRNSFFHHSKIKGGTSLSLAHVVVVDGVVFVDGGGYPPAGIHYCRRFRRPPRCAATGNTSVDSSCASTCISLGTVGSVRLDSTFCSCTTVQQYS